MYIKKKVLYFGLIFIGLMISSAWWLGLHRYNQRMGNALQTLEVLDSSLDIANESICSSNKMMIWDWHDKAKDPAKAEKAGLYGPKISNVIDESERVAEYIEGFKEKIKNNCISNGGTTVLSVDYKAQFVMTKEMNSDLTDTLIVLLKNLNQLLSPKMLNIWQKRLPLADSDQLKHRVKLWLIDGFGNIPSSTALARLTQIQNDVLRSGFLIAQALSENIAYGCNLVSNKFEALAGINSMVFAAGDTAEITAGLGSFTTTGNPIIYINGQQQQLDANGVAFYRKKVGKEEKGKIPVVITFTNPHTGEKTSVQKQISYIVKK